MRRYLLSVCASLLFALTAGAQPARVQFIHNAPDPELATVDLSVDGTRLLDDFAFRTATPFLDLEEGERSFGLAGGEGDGTAAFPLTLEPGGRYVVILSGVRDAGRFSPNPDGRATGLQLLARRLPEGQAMREDAVFVLGAHGLPDAPALAVRRATGAPLIDALRYGDLSEYVRLEPLQFLLAFTPAGEGGVIRNLNKFIADLRPYAGTSGVLLLSGFYDPFKNPGGHRAGLFLALPDGRVVPMSPLLRPN